MSGVCERCNERTSYILNITRLPELAAVAHLGYRQVCAACYDDLLAEANEVEVQDEDRRQEARIVVSIKAQVEGNTSHLEVFSEEMVIKDMSLSGLRLQTVKNIEAGSILKVRVMAKDFEVTAIAESVWRDGGQRSLGLKLVEPSEQWEQLYYEHASEE
ncbi:MAG: PilZ domain-containing protein [Acidobacteria bacterium]|nr:PilZ domain-containing protein [Acidobacteriota bacterium]